MRPGAEAAVRVDIKSAVLVQPADWSFLKNELRLLTLYNNAGYCKINWSYSTRWCVTLGICYYPIKQVSKFFYLISSYWNYILKDFFFPETQFLNLDYNFIN